MSATEFRLLLLNIASVMLVCSLVNTASEAGDVARYSDGRSAAATVKIVPVAGSSSDAIPLIAADPFVGGRVTDDGAVSGDATGIVIAPAENRAAKHNAPVLLSPGYDEQPAQPDRTGESVRVVDSVRPVDDETAPMATETASRKAREEWQKQQASVTDDQPATKRTESRAVFDKSKQSKLEAEGAATAIADSTQKRSLLLQKDPRSYRDIYLSIPFIRTEYDANPAYRHQATMEIMLGQLHPVIVAPASPKTSLTIQLLPFMQSGYQGWWRSSQY
ncbi:MAG: hypothetical protein O3B13_10785 [Planctomycetota bacterium]|nr:hypothetical protein [Planctomycetota bacterium]MDA1163578.1 hypothetical protein [Planctomycetota bacterium]